MVRKIKVASAEDIGTKWGEVTPGRSAYYEAGAVGAGGEWEAAAVAAASSYKAGISAADIEKRFAGGIKRAGGSKYDRKVRDVGVGRFGSGVSAAIPDYKSGIAPFRDTLDGMNIPDRKPRGDPSNYAIVQSVGDALHRKRLSMLGAGGGK
ncbi:MAG: hypothetical protein SVV88_11665 [Pseudomonadota bacterium]|nr:hypothetical protein [Pseudomonadota bacterium]